MLSKNVEIKIYKIVNFPAVLFGCETWSLILNGEHRLRLFENRVMRRILGPMKNEIIGSRRKLHNEEFHNLNTSPNIIRIFKSRRMSWTGHIARMGEKWNIYKVLIGKSER
jgi:hypothetical protein